MPALRHYGGQGAFRIYQVLAFLQFQTMDEFLKIEAQGAEKGLNPMFGQWYQTFNLAPLPISAPAFARTAFKLALRKKLTNRFIFTGEVTLKLRLYLNERKLLNSTKPINVDDYAKLLLDSLKGNGGVLIDECQIRHLDISWTDTPDPSWFEAEINGKPDDFLLTPLTLHKMPDGLYYPLSEWRWKSDGMCALPRVDYQRSIDALKAATSRKRVNRYLLSKEGVTRLGFHKHSIEHAGFLIIDHNSP
jgi:hypothetical protein